MYKFVYLLLIGKETIDALPEYEMFWKKHRFICDTIWDFLGYTRLEMDWDRNLYKERGLVTKFYSHIGKSYKEIINQKYDWDDEGALEANRAVLDYSMKILRYFNNYLLETGHFMVYPSIDLCRDGMIDISWRCDNKIILLYFNKTSIDIYADIKGKIYKHNYNHIDDIRNLDEIILLIKNLKNGYN